MAGIKHEASDSIALLKVQVGIAVVTDIVMIAYIIYRRKYIWLLFTLIILFTVISSALTGRKTDYTRKSNTLLSIVISHVLIPYALLSHCPTEVPVTVFCISTLCMAVLYSKKKALILWITALFESAIIIVVDRNSIILILIMLIFSTVSFVTALVIRAYYERAVEEVALDNQYLMLNNEELQTSSFHDKLTGLYNRGYYDTEMRRAIGAGNRGAEISVMMLDIDHFKSINDTYGHDNGDMALKALAKLIKENVRENDIPCRYGGEEFVVIMYCGIEAAAKRAEQIRKIVEDTEIDIIGSITVSIGVASYSKGMDAESFFKAADKMVYEAKEGGRNQVRTLRKRTYGHLAVVE